MNIENVILSQLTGKVAIWVFWCWHFVTIVNVYVGSKYNVMKLGCDSVVLCSAHYWLSVVYCINPRVHLHFTFTHRLDTVCWPSCIDFTAVVRFGCLMFLWYVLIFVMLIVDKANRRSHWLQPSSFRRGESLFCWLMMTSISRGSTVHRVTRVTIELVIADHECI